MTAAGNKRIILDLDADTSERLEAAAILEGVSVAEYCREAIEVQLDEDADGARRAEREGKRLTPEMVKRFYARREEIIGDKKFPGNSADVIREMREERALQIERAVKGR